jgi:Ca-activated chloride channel family protein
MAGPKLKEAREAVAFAVRQMRPDDLVSLTIYDDRIDTLVRTAPVALAAPMILELLPGIHERGSTALHEAWRRGGLEVAEHLGQGRLNRVLLVSDGIANVGETNIDRIVTHAAELFVRGISTSTIGVGGDFNEDLMIPMAQAGGGIGWYVQSPDDFRNIFASELAGLKAVFGQRATMRIEPRRKGIEVTDLLNDLPKAGEEWALGPLVAGQPLEILARLRVRGGEQQQPLDLFDVRLAWEVPERGRSELQQLFRITCDDPAKVGSLPINAEVDRVVNLLMAARARKEAIRHIDRGDRVQAMGVLSAVEAAQWTRWQVRADADACQDSVELRLLRERLADEKDSVLASRIARKIASYQAYLRAQRSRWQPQ